MTANKMPEMPEARFWIVIGKYEGKPELGPQTFFYYGDNGEPHVEAHERQGDKVDALYTADQMRAMYLAGLEAAKAAFASEWPNGEFRLWDSQWVNCVNHEHAYENSDKQDAVAQAVKLAEKYMGKNIEVALTNLTELEQEAKK